MTTFEKLQVNVYHITTTKVAVAKACEYLRLSKLESIHETLKLPSVKSIENW